MSQLEGEALVRINSAQALAAILGDMAIAMRSLPPDAASRIYRGFLLLAEAQAELLTSEALPHEPQSEYPPEPQSVSDINVERCAVLLRSLSHVEPGQRAQIVMTRMGCSKSSFYRWRSAAIDAGLL